MLTAHNVRPEAAASYYESEDSYYAQEENACGSRWYGKLAEQVCLEGEIDTEDFRRFIYGRAPNGTRIRGVSNAEKKTRGGYDLTFSAPKSVSIQALVWKDPQIIKAHREAVEAVLKEIEKKYSTVEIRTNGQRRKEVTGKLAIATFTHAISRKMDPQLHTHAIIMNTSYCSDGKWRALRNEGFFKDNRRSLGVMYQRELASRLQELGYGVVWKPNDTFDITGYTKEQLRVFSQRTVEIESIAEQKGAKGWREVKHISLQNRPTKKLENPQTLQRQWRVKAKEIDLNPVTPGKVVPLPIPKVPDEVVPRPNAKATDKSIPRPKTQTPDNVIPLPVAPTPQRVVPRPKLKTPDKAIPRPITKASKEKLQKRTESKPSRWTPERLQALEYLRPKHIEAEHWIELVTESAIHPRVAAQYFVSLEGPEAREYLLNYAMGQFSGHGLQHTTKAVEKFLDRYEHLDQGGLWCEGRPFNGEPWGQLKPHSPITEKKDSDRFVLRLQNGKEIHLSKPDDYQPELKERKYESIPKAYKNLPSHRSHYAFADDLDDLTHETNEVWLTEGAKSGASLYSFNKDAIALNGVNGGYSKDDNGKRYLDDHLKQYNWRNRIVVLCPDKDPPNKEKTLRNVAVSMHRLGRLLEQEGAKVYVAEMPGYDSGKLGIDDWLARGNSLKELDYSTLDEWAIESPWIDHDLAIREFEMEQDEGMEY